MSHSPARWKWLICILMSCTWSPPVFDLDTVAASPSSSHCIPFGSFVGFFLWVFLGGGGLFCICHLKRMPAWERFPWQHISDSVSIHAVLFCICSWDCLSARDAEVCSILWTCILTISRAARTKREGRVFMCVCIYVCVCVSDCLPTVWRLLEQKWMNPIEDHGWAHFWVAICKNWNEIIYTTSPYVNTYCTVWYYAWTKRY